MKRPGTFMTAEWKNLLMLNYSVDGSMLESFVPAGTELDAFDGTYYVSLVGFEFNRSRVFGMAIPFHQAFEEVNLRFYVRRGEKRGVVFIREFVPKLAVSMLARLLYNENYSYAPMSHRIFTDTAADTVDAEYVWGSARARCSMRIGTEGANFLPPEGSLSQFITEHYWGYSRQPNGRSLEYEVRHPRWNVRNAKHAAFPGEAANLYGTAFGEVLTREPDSAFVADGSAVSIHFGTRIV